MLIESGTTRLFTAENPLTMTSGATLGPVDVAWERYGELNADRSNALFICHALTGDAHAAGRHAGDAKPGWWDSLIGPGKPVDTDRFHVICANLLGGCAGTTGPASTNPATGESYGLDFPELHIEDFVTVHRALVRSFGIEHLAGVVGGSMGGMQALHWGLRHPDELGSVVVIAASSRLTAQNIAFSAVARTAIMRDPGFHDGRYLEVGDQPASGLSIARMMAHITYLSEEGMAEKFGRRFQEGESKHGFGVDFAVESYLAHQGRTFLNRFDALTYLYLTRSMDYFDPFGAPDAAAAMAARQIPALVVSFDSDWRFDTGHSRRIVRELERARVPVSFREISCPWGHDSFLLSDPDYHATVRAFLTAVAAPDAAAPDAAAPRRTA